VTLVAVPPRIVEREKAGCEPGFTIHSLSNFSLNHFLHIAQNQSGGSRCCRSNGS
jgi:hypothetical protein